MKPFKVAEPVTHPTYGLGVVNRIDNTSRYPIKVLFPDEVEQSFTEDGKFQKDDYSTTLIHGHYNKIKVVPVKPRPVKLKDLKQL